MPVTPALLGKPLAEGIVCPGGTGSSTEFSEFKSFRKMLSQQVRVHADLTTSTNLPCLPPLVSLLLPPSRFQSLVYVPLASWLCSAVGLLEHVLRYPQMTGVGHLAITEDPDSSVFLILVFPRLFTVHIVKVSQYLLTNV